ncbi:hypothetical protein AAG570_007473 [Ranatra chinensis]|uniref:Metalloendopeptidase n=1 Tax=Ranatra chinensis TaxID=642074 RepID=A0ABD0Y8Y7_9HEMI
MTAMEHYHEKSCVRFKEWTGEKDHILVFFNQDSGSCWSPVGRSGGEQKVSLGERCWYHGIVVHELGHSMGFWHEMNRPDRDEWIFIYWQNIVPGFSSAFDKYTTAEVNTLGEKFDFRSIMMYDEYAFSKDGTSPTLQATTGVEIGPIWKKPGLSQSDIRRLHRLYQCNGNKPKPGFPYDVKCDFNSHTCGFKNGGSAVWNWRTFNDTDGYVYSSYEVAGTTLGQFVSVGFHPVTSDDPRGVLGCLRFWYLIQAGGGSATLKLSCAYLDRVTRLDEDPDMMFEIWMNNETSPMDDPKWTHVQVPIYVTRPFRVCSSSAHRPRSSSSGMVIQLRNRLYKPYPNLDFSLKFPLRRSLPPTDLTDGVVPPRANGENSF